MRGSGIVCPAIIISLVVGFPYLTDDLTTFGKPRFVNKTPEQKKEMYRWEVE